MPSTTKTSDGKKSSSSQQQTESIEKEKKIQVSNQTPTIFTDEWRLIGKQTKEKLDKWFPYLNQRMDRKIKSLGKIPGKAILIKCENEKNNFEETFLLGHNRYTSWMNDKVKDWIEPDTTAISADKLIIGSTVIIQQTKMILHVVKPDNKKGSSAPTMAAESKKRKATKENSEKRRKIED